MNVELIYDVDCPNAAAMRSLLVKAFTETGVSARWKEWERGSLDTPDYARCYGSPTILVNGKDIVDAVPDPGTRACRVYRDNHGNLSRNPPLETICSALLTVSPSKKLPTSRWRAAMASVPAIGTVLLPKLTCPLCFPAYTALLGVLGIEFVDYTPYLLPLTVAFLVTAVGALTVQAFRSKKTLPLILAIAGSAVVLVGKFVLELGWLTTSGVALLVIAIFLNIRKRSTEAVPCSACAANGSQQ